MSNSDPHKYFTSKHRTTPLGNGHSLQLKGKGYKQSVENH